MPPAEPLAEKDRPEVDKAVMLGNDGQKLNWSSPCQKCLSVGKHRSSRTGTGRQSLVVVRQEMPQRALSRGMRCLQMRPLLGRTSLRRGVSGRNEFGRNSIPATQVSSIEAGAGGSVDAYPQHHLPVSSDKLVAFAAVANVDDCNGLLRRPMA